uniref:Cytochrome P450 family 2 subfamily J member 2 n=1 Tax=Sus scrofa TaxID=9823 RepID=A0A8D1KLG9_PIG
MLPVLGSLVGALWTSLHTRTLLLSAVALLFFADFIKRQCPKNYPPGPPSLPFIGNYFYLDHKQWHLSLQVCRHLNVLLLFPSDKYPCDFDDSLFIRFSFFFPGLITSKGQVWKEQRRFALTTLRNFGLGKKSLEDCIQEEAQYLIQAIGEENGQPFDPHFKINNAVSNIICSITFGKHFDYQDDQFWELLRLLDEATFLSKSMCCQVSSPWIMKFLPGPHQTLFSNWEKLKMFVAHMIENHRRDWNPAEARDFIDAYLQEIEKHKGDVTSSFHDENLIFTTLDLFGLLYMALYPKIHKVQAEIDRVLGQSQRPNTAARESTPYTNAVIHEVQRMGNIIPMNAPRQVAADTTLAGYHLPKGTMVITNLTALHRDPAEWATPDTFNPEHFLENGKFKKREAFLPFSIGKRACLGEQLARTELFVFFTSLLQKFSFRPPDNEKLSLKFRMGLTLSPVTYRICAVPRA